jgi:hypothetical protein
MLTWSAPATWHAACIVKGMKRKKPFASLCLFLLALSACNFQGPPSIGFYRLSARGEGLIEIQIGFGGKDTSSPYVTSYCLGAVVWTDSYQGDGTWQKDIPVDEVQQRASATPYMWLCIQATGQSTWVALWRFDEKGIQTTEGSQGGGSAGVQVLWPDGGGPPPSIPKVICTELHRQGLMDDRIFKADQAYGRRLRAHQQDVYLGYLSWARPVTSLMKKSPAFTRVVSFFAQPWSREMAFRMGATEKGDFAGRLMMDVGEPLCRGLGRVLHALEAVSKVLARF